MHSPVIALAGNPNVGKSTVFNALTGSQQHVGNWPGKTVEKKEGTLVLRGRRVTVVDLPGTYSLAAVSLEEQIARDFVLRQGPHAVVNVVDAANLERNLYLTAQLLEIGTPLILVLNMSDVAGARGLRTDTVRLAELLKSPVVAMTASTGAGLDELKRAIGAMVARFA